MKSLKRILSGVGFGMAAVLVAAAFVSPGLASDDIMRFILAAWAVTAGILIHANMREL